MAEQLVSILTRLDTLQAQVAGLQNSFSSVASIAGGAIAQLVIGGGALTAGNIFQVNSTTKTAQPAPILTGTQVLTATKPVGSMWYNSTLGLYEYAKSAGQPSHFSSELVATTAVATPFSVGPSTDVVLVNVAGVASVVLPSAVVFGNRELQVCDISGAANTNNITITSAAGNINGASSLVISTPYGGTTFISDGTNWWTGSSPLANNIFASPATITDSSAVVTANLVLASPNAIGANLGIGNGYGTQPGTLFPIALFRPTVDVNGGAGTPLAFDLSPIGTAGTRLKAWIDICNQDVSNSGSTLEFFRVGYNASTQYVTIASNKFGTGTIWPIVMQENGGEVDIGFGDGAHYALCVSALATGTNGAKIHAFQGSCIVGFGTGNGTASAPSNSGSANPARLFGEFYAAGAWRFTAGIECAPTNASMATDYGTTLNFYSTASGSTGSRVLSGSMTPTACTLPGALTLSTAGFTVGLKGGSNACSGTVTLNGATGVVVSTTAVTANSVVLLTFKTLGGTQGAQPVVTARTAGTSFTVAGTALDTSVYNWAIIETNG